MTEVRDAVPTDAPEVAGVHVRSWRSAYRGLIDQDYLDGLTPEAWTSRYDFGRVGLRIPSTLVAVREDTICGFASVGLCRDDELADLGELMALYVDPAHLNTGIGRLLIDAARARLTARGFTAAALWVLRGNDRARRFYERDGWQPDGTERSRVYGGQPAEEVRYRRTLGWLR
ncbi:GNAT family N-acetyltransferase [Mycobacterium sp. TY815]|uniref:GNAT family N-acetyltransferase n=1 Tax=Mycobacterium sp. TY815 TaxID=3050581 RepID=UPI002740BD90|nr:GNAT family N-acetyltransferase [Mycobacterium sp. TY815]MDP7701924.1 GNAT family N-acetyltransferase [Mycobacterium sp. TY815]